jgi:hypothetical protein
MTFDEHNKTAFSFASDQTKQLITLSTGILTLTITLAEKVLGTTTHGERTLLIISWITYSLSILCGVVTLAGLTGSLAGANPSITDWHARGWAIAQFILFVGATGVLVAYGIVAL